MSSSSTNMDNLNLQLNTTMDNLNLQLNNLNLSTLVEKKLNISFDELSHNSSLDSAQNSSRRSSIHRSLKVHKSANDPNFDTLIANTTEKKNIVSIILYHEYKRKIYVLIQRRSNNMTHPGELCGPGGRTEQGETWLESIERETVEEPGIDLSKVDTIIWCADHNINDEKSPIHNIVFAAKLKYKYEYVKPKDINELDQSFFDNNQGEVKNYHKWILIDDLLDGKAGKLLYYFRKSLIKFIRCRRTKEEEISELKYRKFSDEGGRFSRPGSGNVERIHGIVNRPGSGNTERSDRSDKSARSDRSDKSARSDRSERTDRTERTGSDSSDKPISNEFLSRPESREEFLSRPESREEFHEN